MPFACSRYRLDWVKKTSVLQSNYSFKNRLKAICNHKDKAISVRKNETGESRDQHRACYGVQKSFQRKNPSLIGVLVPFGFENKKKTKAKITYKYQIMYLILNNASFTLI